ncbi:MAG: hypothetical protein NW205_13400 [Hyphomicrobiaceae bacterium]|nr:hypothetical protein [Hyphomicrobiaceae bacterium]
MSRKKAMVAKAEFVLFDVYYEDGSRTSNRKVPGSLLGGLDGDEPALTVIEEQDKEISERSGKPRAPIERIVRAGAKVK